MERTIAAIATAYGQGGIGIIRISGPNALPALETIFEPHNPKAWAQRQSHHLYLGHIVQAGQIIDQVLVVYMQGPKSYTAEDVVEIHSHGGGLVQQVILEILLSTGIDMAEPGEFSKRAFLNGRIDLVQAESIIDIIEANNRKGLTLAAGQLSGGLTEQIEEIALLLKRLIASLEASLDFPDDEIEMVSETQMVTQALDILDRLRLMQGTYHQGRLLKDGIATIIVGKPNVGKSSLLNALLKESRAIVTDIPGTTRDTIEEVVNLGRLTLRIMDTAGIRHTTNEVEKIGVARSREALKKADLVLLVFDVAGGIDEEDASLLKEIQALKKPYLLLANKADLMTDTDGKDEMIYISAKYNQGLEVLEKAIEKQVAINPESVSNSTTVTRYRHYALLSQAVHAMTSFIEAHAGLPTDFLTIDLRSAFEALEDILGRKADEDIFDAIFSEFCIGK